MFSELELQLRDSVRHKEDERVGSLRQKLNISDEKREIENQTITESIRQDKNITRFFSGLRNKITRKPSFPIIQSNAMKEKINLFYSKGKSKC